MVGLFVVGIIVNWSGFGGLISDLFCIEGFEVFCEEYVVDKMFEYW